MINFFLPFGEEFEVGNKNAIKRQKAGVKTINLYKNLFKK
jgi:hypothetical protein